MKLKASEMSIGSTIFFVVFAGLIFVGIWALGGWIFQLLWNTFIVTVFSAAPILTFLQAWGIVIFLSFVGSFFGKSSSK